MVLTESVDGVLPRDIIVRTISATAAASPAPARSVFDAAGSGASLNVALTIAARLPNDPVTSFDRS